MKIRFIANVVLCLLLVATSLLAVKPAEASISTRHYVAKGVRFERLEALSSVQTADNNYDIIYSVTNRKLHIGDKSNTSRFIPKMTFGAWDDYQIELTLKSNTTRPLPVSSMCIQRCSED